MLGDLPQQRPGHVHVPGPHTCRSEELLFLGSVNWLEGSAFDDHDLAALQKHRAAITGEPVPLVAVSRSGTTCSELQAAYGPGELIGAWRRT